LTHAKQRAIGKAALKRKAKLLAKHPYRTAAEARAPKAKYVVPDTPCPICGSVAMHYTGTESCSVCAGGGDNSTKKAKLPNCVHADPVLLLAQAQWNKFPHQHSVSFEKFVAAVYVKQAALVDGLVVDMATGDPLTQAEALAMVDLTRLSLMWPNGSQSKNFDPPPTPIPLCVEARELREKARQNRAKASHWEDYVADQWWGFDLA
jgi:hypothetical protein